MRTLRRLTLFALAAFVLSLALAAGASAQYREFTGRIKSLSKDKMLVDNRMDDQVPFARFDGTVIEDASGGEKPKKEWRDLEKGDWITVHWKLADKPRKAYKVIVLPPKGEAGTDL